ncbi:resuscitation-promoting factor protein RpfC [Streptomyces deserti]
MTGSAIAIPLLGATGASAADGTTWDRVADCETGGAWSQNSGNGYYGGLQLSQEDWDKYGGLDYAASPDLASRSQQIAVAERILADQGVGVWRTCGLLAGLDKDSSSADIDTGVASDTSGSSDSSNSSGSSASPDSPGLLDSLDSSSSSSSSGSSDSSASSPESTSPSPSSDGASNTGDESAKSGTSSASTPTADPESEYPDNSGHNGGSSALTDTGATDTGATDPGASGTGRHRGPSADEAAGDGRTAEPAGRHASRGDAAARDAMDGSYTVRPGDSLWSISDSLDLSGGWRALYVENEKVIGADPDLIRPGQTLQVGVEPGEK